MQLFIYNIELSMYFNMLSSNQSKKVITIAIKSYTPDRVFHIQHSISISMFQLLLIKRRRSSILHINSSRTILLSTLGNGRETAAQMMLIVYFVKTPCVAAPLQRTVTVNTFAIVRATLNKDILINFIFIT